MGLVKRPHLAHVPNAARHESSGVGISSAHPCHADEAPWSKLLLLLDDSWYIDCPIEVAMQRVIERHVSTGRVLEAAQKRVATNDRPNAELIHGTRGRARLKVPSLLMREP